VANIFAKELCSTTIEKAETKDELFIKKKKKKKVLKIKLKCVI
jgi:hypothetical protein